MGIQRFPNLLRWTVLACCLPYPGDPKSAIDCFFLFGISLHPGVTGSAPHWKFRGCRVHSFPSPQELLRPASWLALLSRTFTFELATTRSPSISVEYDYVDKQSIPTAGLSPASPTALWAAGHRISRISPRLSYTKISGKGECLIQSLAEYKLSYPPGASLYILAESSQCSPRASSIRSWSTRHRSPRSSPGDFDVGTQARGFHLLCQPRWRVLRRGGARPSPARIARVRFVEGPFVARRRAGMVGPDRGRARSRCGSWSSS